MLLLAQTILPVAISQAPAESEVKAADLLNFGRFMSHAHPSQSASSFDICILGDDQTAHSLHDIAAHESINDRPVSIRQLKDVTDAKGCAILYISKNEGDGIREDLAILRSSEILTVSDAPDFLERGGMIQFLMVENHVRFAINLNAVDRANLVLSSELLRVATSVNGKPLAEVHP